MFRKGLVFRLIGVVLLIVLMVAGSTMAYKAGLVQGISQAPAVATAISKAVENGQGAPMMYGPGYYKYGHPQPFGFGYRHTFGFLPLGGICLSIFFLFLFLGFLKMIFFRGMGWGPHGHHHGPPWMRHEGDGGYQVDGKKDESPEEKK